MKTAVITPVWDTPRPWLEQCADSVGSQTLPCTHFLICEDNRPPDIKIPSGVQVLYTSGPHDDCGNAARAIGSVSAIAHGFDAIAYLDSDNWFERNHLELLWRTQRQTDAAVCSSGRNLVNLAGELLGKCPEVDGEKFVDTSCMFLTRKAFPLVAAWYLMPNRLTRIGDRYVWHAIQKARLSRAHQPLATVNYRTNYQAHYRHFGLEPPRGAKSSVVFHMEPLALTREGRSLPAKSGGESNQSAIPSQVNRPRIKVSLCMIARNEEEHLAACLRPLTKIVDEILVVDCGSIDRTVEIAESLGARVINHTWSDSFAAARNEWFKHATGDWIFWLDADERVDETNIRRLQKLFAQLPEENVLFLMKQWSPTGNDSKSPLIVDHTRLFRKLHNVAWRYRVHEQILLPLTEKGARVLASDVVIEHHGYECPSTRHKKLLRNLRLLEMNLSDQPNEAFVHFNIGITSIPLNQPERARSHLQRCIDLAPKGASFVAKAYALLCQMCRNQPDLEFAAELCKKGRAAFPQDIELSFEEGMICLARRDRIQARHCFERILAAPPQPTYSGMTEGIRGHLTRHQLAILAKQENRLEEAEAQWRESTRCCPEFGPGWLGMTEVLLMQGRWHEVERTIDQLAVKRTTALIGGMLRARLLLAKRQVMEARRSLEQLSSDYPQNAWPRTMLCELIIREKLDDAVIDELLTQIVAIDPSQHNACRKLEQLHRQTRSQVTSPPAESLAI